jgi:hypothetical protein
MRNFPLVQLIIYSMSMRAEASPSLNGRGLITHQQNFNTPDCSSHLNQPEVAGVFERRSGPVEWSGT